MYLSCVPDLLDLATKKNSLKSLARHCTAVFLPCYYQNSFKTHTITVVVHL